jgi:hypothetical protein
MMAFSNLAFLYDVDLVMAIVRDENLLLQKEASKRIAYFIIAKQTIPFLGLILGTITIFSVIWQRYPPGVSMAFRGTIYC